MIGSTRPMLSNCQWRWLAIAVVVVGGCLTPPKGSPPIVWISLDTFRGDLVGGEDDLGYPLTPALDDFSMDAVVFEQAVMPYAHTLTSHMSMMTGVYPGVHGVYPSARASATDSVLPDSISTVVEILKEHGYNTAARVTSEWLKPDFGFGRGFDSYERLPHGYTYADRVRASAEELILARAGTSTPLFLFLHFYDAHSDFGHGPDANRLPYSAPGAYLAGLGLSEDGREFCDSEGRCNTAYLSASNREGRKLPDPQVRKIRSLYDAGVKYLDSEIGLLFAALKDLGLYDETVIILTADHGEEFQEHGRFIHSQPYDETAVVPLMIKLPGSERGGSRVRDVVELLDIRPTIEEIIGDQETEFVQGRSLLPLLRGAASAASDQRVALIQESINRRRYALRSGVDKLIVNFGIDGNREYYDLTRDAAEAHNTAPRHAERVAEMKDLLDRKIRRNRTLGKALAGDGARADDVLSEEEKKTLEALGYVN